MGVDVEVDAVATSGDVSPFLAATVGGGKEVGAVGGGALADVGGDGVGVVDVVEVVGGEPDGAAIVGRQRQRLLSRVDRRDPTHRAVPDVEVWSVVVSSADEAVAFCPFASVGDEAFGSEESSLVHPLTGETVQFEDIRAVVREDQRP